MKQIGKAQSEWHEQAEKAEAYLLEKQDPTAIKYTDAEGHTDAISGVSIHVMGFFKLAEKALANGPVQRGPYKDGTYHAEQENFDAKTGWKETVDLTVINGNIVAANWNAVNKAGGDDKKTQSEKGVYAMKEKGKAQSEWHEQAAKAEAYLLEKQDPTAIKYTDAEGHTDAISGVSIHVMGFFKLAEQALSQAK
ncbi:FMN-binding protein [Fervidicella metallireducens]|uniref:FMN-binding protein n=1 Tax=Fervidicella metallireducens TaxID=655338 RepID=UPI000A96E92D|nr:FMN-binding protein [Fervidicella metallireducens]